MNRRYKSSEIFKSIDDILHLIPDIALGADFITGFPGENERAFNNTKSLIKQYPFSNLHIFPYSERRGTPAASFKASVDHKIRKERALELIAVGKIKRKQYAQSWIGRRVDLLIESFDQSGNACGWSSEYIGCKLKGIPPERQKEALGTIVSFVPTAVDGDVLESIDLFSHLNQSRIPTETTVVNSIDTETLNSAARILCDGGVVIIPTDTVYGIAAHPDCDAALNRICTIKGRPTGKPVALLAANKTAVLEFCKTVPVKADKLMDTLWPGALTLVLPCGDGFEGFRVPDHDQTRELIKVCGGTLRVTSANLSGSMPAKNAAEALKDIGLAADLVVDGGISPGGVASTVVKVEVNNTLTILREGAISSEQIYSLL